MTAAIHNLYGLVLAGGASSRMGSDKAFLNYHHKPQVYYVADMLQEFCENVFVSCNPEQAARFEPGIQLLADETQYAGCGPIAALLTAARALPGKNLLVLACDYPLVGTGHLQQLVEAWQQQQTSVSFRNAGGVREALIALYTHSHLQQLEAFYKTGQQSLRYFLDSIQAAEVTCADPDVLTSVDTPQAYRAALEKLKA